MINASIVFASGSRTNAGVDNISTSRKMKTFESSGERMLVASGNLPITQSTLNHLDQAILHNCTPNIMNVASISADTSINDAIKSILVSFDSTMQSNLSVGLPIDMACYKRHFRQLELLHRFDEHDTYMQSLHMSWGEGVRRAFSRLPNFDECHNGLY
jgi:predicted proteasome-type protease